MRWDPQEYARYADERGRPFGDLLARVGAEAPRRVVDVGCGPGRLTAGLAERWPSAVVEGLDSSPEMIASAAPLATDRLTFGSADARTYTPPADTDVLVSNATLQWVPDHLDVVARWAAAVPPGGWLAVQVPGNFGSPTHALMRDLAESPRFGVTTALRRDAVAEPSTYAQVLRGAGLRADVWETTYLHVLTGEDPVLQWVRGTGLRPILAALDEESRPVFEAEYGAQLREAYPQAADGTTILPFRRIFFVGHRP
jgi:trans-aconitate 2-methyltransferase